MEDEKIDLEKDFYEKTTRGLKIRLWITWFLIPHFFINGTSRCLDQKKEKKLNDKMYGEIECSLIMINNGEEYINNNATKTGHTNDNYDLSYYDGKSIVLYIYGEDPIERKIYTDFILSNIVINEENNVFFDQNSITKESFEEYKNKILSDNEETIQRKRTN